MDRSVYDRMAQIQSQHWWYEGRRRILREVILQLGLPEQSRILEAGCGPGANLTMLQEFGDVSAFEPDEEARAHAAMTSDVEPVIGFLPDQIPFDGPFDLVAAFDVIEHVEDDVASCTALHGLLRPGGYGVFTVPAFPWMWSTHDEANHHFRRYRRPGLRSVLLTAGFEDPQVSYFNTLLFPAVAGVRAVRRALKRPGPGDDSMPRSMAVNRALEHLFAAERHAVTRASLPYGVSLLAVARRPEGAGPAHE